jgi:hypothetical protein
MGRQAELLSFVFPQAVNLKAGHSYSLIVLIKQPRQIMF